ncbi:GCN5-related N-acetyltransferase [Rippkaea orientalis PCC 8801]|uniref:GCN5-related N-acetyltransferase n=1 Tax=Rippkaea orientalis (strain PCC 8801 / RF-1) TaxID=41431 RepID=B7K4F4_RIPO1|nr:GNAT family N-acetyltransferase [Rippkaea orientalis]ACK65419.1 GCN5-related N-acetyltransferase [Rippkaea orientalis PCC 8801]
MLVRTYQQEDIPQIAKLYYNTVHVINSQDYTPEQIQAWAPEIYPKSYWQKRFKKYQVYVVEIEGVLAGFAELESNGHIDCFYVHHQWQRKGVGKQLMKHLETEAKTLNIPYLFAEVSITAKPFFQRMGFVITEERQKDYRQVYFQQFLMKKSLTEFKDKECEN